MACALYLNVLAREQQYWSEYVMKYISMCSIWWRLASFKRYVNAVCVWTKCIQTPNESTNERTSDWAKGRKIGFETRVAFLKRQNQSRCLIHACYRCFSLQNEWAIAYKSKNCRNGLLVCIFIKIRDSCYLWSQVAFNIYGVIANVRICISLRMYV